MYCKPAPTILKDTAEPNLYVKVDPKDTQYINNTNTFRFLEMTLKGKEKKGGDPVPQAGQGQGHGGQVNGGQDGKGQAPPTTTPPQPQAAEPAPQGKPPSQPESRKTENAKGDSKSNACEEAIKKTTLESRKAMLGEQVNANKSKAEPDLFTPDKEFKFYTSGRRC